MASKQDMLEGGHINVDDTRKTTDNKGRVSNSEMAHIPASNGAVYVIDTVLILK